jgi:uncharacterized membrane protein YbhN (UPF0104 family)
LTAKNKSVINWCVKAGIFILATMFIWKKLVNNKNLDNFRQMVQGLNKTQVIVVLTAVFLLMLVNWVTEAYKWRMQLKDIAVISLWTSIQSVFCGLTVGVITPNRIGDYGARVFFLSPRRRAYGLVALGIGALAQFILITIGAAIAVCIFLQRFKDLDAGIIVALSTVFAIFAGMLSLLYFNMGIIKTLIDKVKFLTRYKHFFDILSDYKKPFLIKILAICLFRLCLLIVQYYLIIHLLIPGLTFMQVTLMITLIIGVQTVLPTIEILDIGVRGATSIYFFSFITHQDIAILAASSLIWFINLIIPAIIGLSFVHKLKIFSLT